MRKLFLKIMGGVVSLQRAVVRFVEGLPGYPTILSVSMVVTAPVRGLADRALRRFPGLRRLEWLLETDSLRHRHPVMLAVLLLLVFSRGLQTTALGHIGTDVLIYPLLGAISYFNPFLGIVSALTFGLGDLIQKLFLNDIFGSRGIGSLSPVARVTDLNYWGGVLGYLISYSSLVVGGLLPGMLARVFRHTVRHSLRLLFFRRTADAADGAIPRDPQGWSIYEAGAGRAKKLLLRSSPPAEEVVQVEGPFAIEEACEEIVVQAERRVLAEAEEYTEEVIASGTAEIQRCGTSAISRTVPAVRGALEEVREQEIGVFTGRVEELQEAEAIIQQAGVRPCQEGVEEVMGATRETLVEAAGAVRGTLIEGVEHESRRLQEAMGAEGMVALRPEQAAAMAERQVMVMMEESRRAGAEAMDGLSQATLEAAQNAALNLEDATRAEVVAGLQQVLRSGGADAATLRAAAAGAAQQMQQAIQNATQAATGNATEAVQHAAALQQDQLLQFLRNLAAAGPDPTAMGAPPMAASPAGAPAAEYPVAEFLASLLGAGLGGFSVMRFTAPVLEYPAFYLRPDPDVGCYQSEVNTYLHGGAISRGATGPLIGGPLLEGLVPPGGTSTDSRVPPGTSPTDREQRDDEAPRPPSDLSEARDEGQASNGEDAGPAPDADTGRPDWVDPEYEREQREWWRSNLADERQRLDSWLQHRGDDPDFSERAEDMRRSIDYYQQKLNEQDQRLSQWDIDAAPERATSQWDPFAVSQLERDARAEIQRRQNWQQAFDKFDKMRDGAIQRGHEQYGDPARWDRAMDHIFREDGTVDPAALNRARDLFQTSIQADIDQYAPEHTHWLGEAALDTVKDAKNNIVIRGGAAYLTGGTSEIVFETLDQVQRMHEYVQYHDKGGGAFDAFSYGVQELAKDRFAIREIQTLTTGQVTNPDGTKRAATGWDYALNAVGGILKGRDFASTVGGEFWETKAFGIKGEDVRNRVSGLLGEADAPTTRALDDSLDDATPSTTRSTDAGDAAEGAPTRGTGDAAEAAPTRGGAGDGAEGAPAGGGGGDGGGSGGGSGGGIPPHLTDDYDSLQRALQAGDDVEANRFATRMLARDYDEFKSLVSNGTIDQDTAARALANHQRIVAEGIKEGINRTRRMGNLLDEMTDADGVTTPAPVERMWSPGSGMEPLEARTGPLRVPGDTDITPVVDTDLCTSRGLDPHTTQSLAAGHTTDAINEIARAELGDDVGNYTQRTNTKVFQPGLEDEYFSYHTHEMPGTGIDADGSIQSTRTTLGEEMGSPPGAEVIRESPTGQSMASADEAMQMRRVRAELDAAGEVSPATQQEVARELAKHHQRLIDNAGWNPDQLPEGSVGSGFQQTLEAAQSGNTDRIAQAVGENYGGDYDAFYKDCQTSANQAVRNGLDSGGQIWDAQAYELQRPLNIGNTSEPGIRIDRTDVVPHHPSQPAFTSRSR